MMRQNRKKEIEFTKEVTSKIRNQKEEGKRNPIFRKGVGVCLNSLFITLILAGCIGMYQDVFTMEQAVVYVVTGGIFSMILVLAYGLIPKKKWVCILTTLVLLALLGFNWKSIWEGMTVILNEILHKVNSYYSIHISDFVIEGSEEINPRNAFLFLTAGLVFFMVSLSVWKKKIWGVALPGILLFVTELLVGYAPGGRGILLFLTGVFALLPVCVGANARKKDEEFFRYGIGAGLGGMVMLVAVILSVTIVSPAQKVVEMQKDVLAYQRYYENLILNWKALSFLGGETGKVTNHMPLYTNRDVMTISTYSIPGENLYLRGYVGDTYEYGDWKNNSERNFATVSEELGISEQEAGMEIQDFLYQSQSEAGMKLMKFQINYLSTGNQYAYLPYFVNLESATQEIRLEADGIIERSGLEAQNISGYTGYSLQTVMRNAKEEGIGSDLAEQYEDYLSLYLQLPEGLEQLDALGAEMREQYDKIENAGVSEEYQMLAAACLVRNVVNDYVTYSLNLEELLPGEDIVEQFLFESKKGYCTHYASAGTLLFRELGIPARYVTGYVVESSEFRGNGDGTFTANIKDNAAHAWVEIYLEGAGWYPIEMITGFDEEFDTMRVLENNSGDLAISYYENDDMILDVIYDSNNEVTVDEWSYMTPVMEDSNTVPEEMQEETSEAQPLENPNLDLEQEVEQTESITDNVDSETSQQAGTQDQNGADISLGNGNNTQTTNQSAIENTRLIKRIRNIVLVFTAIAVLVFGVRKGIRWYQKRLQASFQQSNYRRAIRSITRQMTKKLRRKGKLLSGKADDDDFFEALLMLKEPLEKDEVSKLRFILERAAFSQEELQKEEVTFCYQMYQKLL